MAEEKTKSTSPGKTTKPKMNKVHFIATDRGLFPFSALKKAEIGEGKRPESKQAKADYRYQTMKELVPLPFDVETLLTLQENCTIFDAVVRQIAKDVVGNGWQLVEVEEDKGKEEEKKIVEDFLNDPNDSDETIDKIIERGVIDRGVTGWMAIEVSRDSADKIDGLWHLPAHTIRIHKSKEKFYQKRGQQHMWFKRFGAEGNISAKTGKEISSSKDAAHELIYMPRYYPKSDYYGIPAALPAVGSVLGLIGTRDYNLAFFENYGIPAAIVTLKGEWPEGSAEHIQTFIDAEIRGSASAHKTLVLEIPEVGEMKWEPLGAEVKEGSFSVYMKAMRDDLLMAYKMPPYRVGITETGSLGGNIAVESTKIYVQSIIGPIQKDIAAMMTRMILKDGMEIETWQFEFNPIDIRDLEALTKIWKEWFGMGVINANYIMHEIGLEEQPHGNDYYVLVQYLPIGEQSVEKREAGQIALMEDMQRAVNEALERINKVTATVEPDK